MPRASVLVVLAIAIGGCDSISGDLSRGKAADVVARALAYDAEQHRPNTSFDACVDEGTLTRELQSLGYLDGQGRLTEAGRTVIQSYHDYGAGRRLDLNEPVRMEVANVTGVVGTDSPEQKQVEFEWKYVGVPNELAALHKAGGTGFILVARYDDGWRFLEKRKGRVAGELSVDSQCMQSAK